MNQLFLEAAARPGEGRRGGLAGRVQPLDTDTPRSERLTRLLDERETALKAGDADALDFVEHKIDRLFEESRQARTADGSDQGAEQPQPPGFDGGVRGRRSPPMPGVYHETAASLFVRAMLTSRQERAERDADSGQTIIANNF